MLNFETANSQKYEKRGSNPHFIHFYLPVIKSWPQISTKSWFGNTLNTGHFIFFKLCSREAAHQHLLRLDSALQTPGTCLGWSNSYLHSQPAPGTSQWLLNIQPLVSFTLATQCSFPQIRNAQNLGTSLGGLRWRLWHECCEVFLSHWTAASEPHKRCRKPFTRCRSSWIEISR